MIDRTLNPGIDSPSVLSSTHLHFTPCTLTSHTPCAVMDCPSPWCLCQHTPTHLPTKSQPWARCGRVGYVGYMGWVPLGCMRLSPRPPKSRHGAIWPRAFRQGHLQVPTVILHPFSLDLGEYWPRYGCLSDLHDM